jgi:hypothetical protein
LPTGDPQGLADVLGKELHDVPEEEKPAVSVGQLSDAAAQLASDGEAVQESRTEAV